MRPLGRKDKTMAQKVKKIGNGKYRVYGVANDRNHTEVRYAKKSDAEHYMNHCGGYLVYEDWLDEKNAQNYLNERCGEIWW